MSRHLSAIEKKR